MSKQITISGPVINEIERDFTQIINGIADISKRIPIRGEIAGQIDAEGAQIIKQRIEEIQIRTGQIHERIIGSQAGKSGIIGKSGGIGGGIIGSALLVVVALGGTSTRVDAAGVGNVVADSVVERVVEVTVPAVLQASVVEVVPVAVDVVLSSVEQVNLLPVVVDNVEVPVVLGTNVLASLCVVDGVFQPCVLGVVDVAFGGVVRDVCRGGVAVDKVVLASVEAVNVVPAVVNSVAAREVEVVPNTNVVLGAVVDVVGVREDAPRGVESSSAQVASDRGTVVEVSEVSVVEGVEAVAVAVSSSPVKACSPGRGVSHVAS